MKRSTTTLHVVHLLTLDIDNCINKRSTFAIEAIQKYAGQQYASLLSLPVFVYTGVAVNIYVYCIYVATILKSAGCKRFAIDL